jgi:hypothetical protein
MTFHYIRKNDSNGTIQRVNGMGMGLPLLKLQGVQRKLPLACNIEIIRFAADILNDSLKNKFVHGDIKMENLSVLNDGSLIINGYDRPRRNSITPEGNISLPGDIYGLGVVMLELLAGKRNIELPLDENLHNQTVLKIFLGIEWQEWAQQPWLNTMQEYLISLLFYDPGQRPHPLDIANILKEAAQTTTSLNIQQYMMHNELCVKNEQESLEMARTLRSSALIRPVEVMADSEGTATGYFTRDKIAQMFQEPVEEERARHTEWSPDNGSDNQHANDSLDLAPPPQPQISARQSTSQRQPTTPNWQTQQTPPVEKTTQNSWSSQQSVSSASTHPHQPSSPRQSGPTPTWQEQPTATNPTPPQVPTHQTPIHQQWQAPPSIQEQPTPSLPPRPQPRPQNRHNPSVPTRPSQSTPPQIAIGVGQQSIHNHPPPALTPNWAPPPPPPPPPPNSTIGTKNPSGGLSGGINQWIILGGAGLALLLITIGLLVWQLFFTKTEDTVPDRSTTDQITIEQIEAVPDRPEEIEIPNEPDKKTTQVEKEPQIEKPTSQKKATQSTQRNSTKRTSSTGSTKKSSPPKNRTAKKTTPKNSTPAPTTVGLGKFSVTITFEKEAALKCGDGQSKDFVRQTTMTFQTRTACRINTEDGERGALTASKSGTIQCSLSGERIRCK